jgi:glyoxylase-like metal-dependent hydrolase (beta-lactamase superfamily II)
MDGLEIRFRYARLLFPGHGGRSGDETLEKNMLQLRKERVRVEDPRVDQRDGLAGMFGVS